MSLGPISWGPAGGEGLAELPWDCLFKVLRKEPTFSSAPHTLCLGRWASRYSRYKSCCLNIHKLRRLPRQGHLVDLQQNVSLRSHHRNIEFFIKRKVLSHFIWENRSIPLSTSLIHSLPPHLATHSAIKHCSSPL